MLTPVSLVRLHFFGRFSSFFSLASHDYYSLHCLSFVSSFSLCFPFSFGNFIGLSGSSFGALAPSGLSSTSCFCLFSYRVFCITCASFWFSGFLGFPSGVSRQFSALVYLFHGSPLLPFELLATRLLPSSFIFLYTFSSILLPSPASRRLCTGSSFFSSVHSSFPLPLSLLLVWLLALGAFVLLLFRLFPTLFLAVPVEHLRIWLVFIFLSRLLISHLSLAILFMVPCPLCLRSSLFVVAFPPVLPPWWSHSRFLCLGTRFSFLLSFFRWECVPGSGALLFPTTFLP